MSDTILSGPIFCCSCAGVCSHIGPCSYCPMHQFGPISPTYPYNPIQPSIPTVPLPYYPPGPAGPGSPFPSPQIGLVNPQMVSDVGVVAAIERLTQEIKLIREHVEKLVRNTTRIP